jgi:hypothetical protein
MFVIRVAYPEDIRSGYMRTEERCAAVSVGGRCCPRDRDRKDSPHIGR